MRFVRILVYEGSRKALREVLKGPVAVTWIGQRLFGNHHTIHSMVDSTAVELMDENYPEVSEAEIGALIRKIERGENGEDSR